MDNIAVVITNDNRNVSVKDSIVAIAQAGFKNVFLQWYDNESEFDQFAQMNYARSLGLNVIFAHLGYQGINNIWLDNEEGEALCNRWINDIKTCKENNIDFVVIHLTSKTVAPDFGPVGLNRFKRICDYAQSIGVTVAFENTKIKGYMDYILKNITNDNVGFCFDVGHFHAHFNDEFDFDLVKNRIYAVHLHDNFGDKDSHFLPYDGNINWDSIINDLKYVNYKGYITLEVVYSEKYLDMSILDYYKKAYDVACGLKEKLNG